MIAINRNDVNWHGYWPAAPTPFTAAGDFDEDGLRRILRLYRDQGVHGVLMNGTTGEWFSQSEAERRRVAEIAVDELGGQIPVVIGCTTFNTPDTVELVRHAASIGADGAMSTPPPYSTPTPREIIAFYETISDSVDFPLMVYNWPRGTGVDITPDVATALASLPTVVAIKDSTANRVQITETIERVSHEVLVFASLVNRLGLAVLTEIGGDGSIDGGGLGAVWAVEFYNAVWANDFEAARLAAKKYVSLMRRLINPDWSGAFGSPQAQLKAAMNLLGQPGGYPRPPLLPVDDAEGLARLEAVLETEGLTKQTVGRREAAPAVHS